MAIKVITSIDDADPENDYVYRTQRAAAEQEKKVRQTETFRKELVTVEYGAPDLKTRKRPSSTVVLKVPYDSQFAFAVYAENPEFHVRDRLEWEACAKDALEKFAAMAGVAIKLGPRPEDMNRYNFMVEMARPLEWLPETLERMRERRREWEEYQARIDQQSSGRYRRIQA
jgi:hypothetical protein